MEWMSLKIRPIAFLISVMSKNRVLFAVISALLLTSCGKDTQQASFSSSVSTSSGKSQDTSSSQKIDYGPDPTGVYERESYSFISESINTPYTNPYTYDYLMIDYDRLYYGPSIKLNRSDSWVNVKIEGQGNAYSGIRGSSTGTPTHGYGDWQNGEELFGREFKGVGGDWDLPLALPETSCLNPDEVFMRLVFVSKEDINTIIGYALAVGYPIGDPVEADDEELDLYHYYKNSSPTSNPDRRVPPHALAWITWKLEAVSDGVFFPKVNDEFQKIEEGRVEAALDIMVENARGHYFTKPSSSQTSR